MKHLLTIKERCGFEIAMESTENSKPLCTFAAQLLDPFSKLTVFFFSP